MTAEKRAKVARKELMRDIAARNGIPRETRYAVPPDDSQWRKGDAKKAN